jgi:hypothetical protein
MNEGGGKVGSNFGPTWVQDRQCCQAVPGRLRVSD